MAVAALQVRSKTRVQVGLVRAVGGEYFPARYSSKQRALVRYPRAGYIGVHPRCGGELEPQQCSSRMPKNIHHRAPTYDTEIFHRNPTCRSRQEKDSSSLQTELLGYPT